MNARTPFTSEPNARGYWGEFGGRYVAETLMAPLEELTAAFDAARSDPAFLAEFRRLLADISGRPTPLTFAERLTAHAGGARIWLKREDLGHTGSHKINNAIGQALLALRMGKRRIIAETGAGQHGVASATVCARFGLQCVVYMGAEDARRQALNVTRMRMLGAEVREVHAGSRTLKDAINEALRDWVSDPDSFYMLGSALGPHPYPLLVREFQRVIGEESRAQFVEREGKLPDQLIACVGGGSNAIGFFHPFLADEIDMLAVEAGGKGSQLGTHAARFHEGGGGRPGVLHGTRSFVLQDEGGQTAGTHSISAGLDYPAVGPEHADLRARGRVRYTCVGDREALDAFGLLARLEGLIPALESSHAIAAAVTEATRLGPGKTILVNLSGRGDKDVAEVAALTDR